MLTEAGREEALFHPVLDGGICATRPAPTPYHSEMTQVAN